MTTKMTITHVTRYVDYNNHVPESMWDTPKGMSQRMYAVWMLDANAETFVSFIKRTNKSLGDAVRAGMEEVHGGHVDGARFDLGTVIEIKKSKTKCVKEPCEHKGEFLPRRTVLTHVSLITRPPFTYGPLQTQY